MPSSQNDIGLYANQLTERAQQQVDISMGGVVTLTPPTGFDNVPLVVLVQAQGGAYRYTNNATDNPSDTFGILVVENGVLTFVPADPTLLKFHRDGTDATILNVAWYTFARASEI
jgi:hypothetical protein